MMMQKCISKTLLSNRTGFFYFQLKIEKSESAEIITTPAAAIHITANKLDSRNNPELLMYDNCQLHIELSWAE